MNLPRISIIVPVYQVEKYLEKCITSIITQTYKNLEIILVDDGSIDNCPMICDQFQKKDARIKVIHQKNGGLSYARNIGLKIATGEYIGFVDSDDWIEPNMYEILMSALQTTGADIAVCGRQIEYENFKPNSIDIKASEINFYSAEEALKIIIQDRGFIRNAVWDKLFKRNILQEIKFPKNKIYEDILWTAQVIGNANIIIYIDYPLYHYFQHIESLTHNDNITLKRRLDKIEMLTQRLAYSHKHFPTFEKLAIKKLRNTCFQEYIYISLNNQFDTDSKLRQKIYQLFCLLGPINILEYDGVKTTIGHILFGFSPKLLMKIYAIYQKIH